jgi:hypothetical protein
MIKFTKPNNLNGAELLAELNAAGVLIQKSPLIDGEGNFWLDIVEADKAKATPIVAAHNGTIVSPEPTVADKLAAAGLRLDELKAALGL